MPDASARLLGQRRQRWPVPAPSTSIGGAIRPADDLTFGGTGFGAAVGTYLRQSRSGHFRMSRQRGYNA